MEGVGLGLAHWHWQLGLALHQAHWQQQLGLALHQAHWHLGLHWGLSVILFCASCKGCAGLGPQQAVDVCLQPRQLGLAHRHWVLPENMIFQQLDVIV